MPSSIIHFTPSRAKNSGISSMKTISDTCPYDCIAAAFGYIQFVQELIGERVIELQRNANQERTDDEHEKRPLLHECRVHRGRAHRSPIALSRRDGGV